MVHLFLSMEEDFVSHIIAIQSFIWYQPFLEWLLSLGTLHDLEWSVLFQKRIFFIIQLLLYFHILYDQIIYIFFPEFFILVTSVFKGREEHILLGAVVALNKIKILIKKEGESMFDRQLIIASVVSDSVGPHRRKPTRLPCPWSSQARTLE